MTFRRRPDRKLAELRRLPLLRTCPEAELRRFARAADPSEHRSGTILAEEGQTQRWFHLIVEGRAEVWEGGVHVGTLGPGQTVGEATTLSSTAAPVTVVTDGPGRTFVIGTRQLRGLVADCPVLAANLIDSLSHQVVALETARTAAASPRLRLVPTAG